MRLYLYLKLAKWVVLIQISKSSEWERTWPLAESSSVQDMCVLQGKQGTGVGEKRRRSSSVAPASRVNGLV